MSFNTFPGWTHKFKFTRNISDDLQGDSIPLSQWYIFPMFQTSPYFRQNFSNSIFICQNFWWPIFSFIDYKFEISPYFRCFGTFLLISEKIIFLPTFTNLLPWFRKFYVFFQTVCVFPFSPTLTMMHDASHNVPELSHRRTMWFHVGR